MKLLTFALVILFLCTLVHGASAQDLSNWVKVTPPDEQFAVMMPQSPQSKSQKNTYGHLEVDATVYSVTEDGRVYTVWSMKNRAYLKGQPIALEDYLDECAELVWESLLKSRREKPDRPRINEMSYQRKFQAGGLPGREYLLKFGAKRGVVRFFVSEDKIYVLGVYNASADEAGATRFLTSFEPDREKTTAQSLQADADANNNNRRLRLRGGPGQGGNPPGGNDASNSTPGAVDNDRVFAARETTERARILSRPEPMYTERARKFLVAGTVVLEAVLAKTGEVTNIRVVRGLPHGLTRTALEAMQAMRFTPATKDGIPVSQRVIVEYNYNIY